MKLMWKFNIVLLALFAVGFVLTGFISYSVLQANAREEILDNARVMMESALASRSYTNSQVTPLLETQLRYTFLPQTVPAYAATEQFNDLRKKYPDYSYKEATLNPTNPSLTAATPSLPVSSTVTPVSGSPATTVATSISTQSDC